MTNAQQQKREYAATEKDKYMWNGSTYKEHCLKTIWNVTAKLLQKNIALHRSVYILYNLTSTPLECTGETDREGGGRKGEARKAETYSFEN